MSDPGRAEGPETSGDRDARESRKSVTAIFVDVVGSTALAEALDPEALRDVMQRYFDECRSVIERNGGVVEKFIGDAVVGVFGVPTLHEDDSLRAVTAAAQIRARLAALNDELEQTWGVRLSTRCGVEAGPAIAGEGAGGSYATGPAVSTAARLEQAVSPGEILVGEQAYRLVQAAVVAEEIEPLTLKGKPAPVRAWRLVEVIPGVPGWTRQLDSPLVGRQADLARLMETFERAARGGGCHIATVMAAAGVGKSRLGHEAVGRMRQRATVLRGRCLPYGEGITFWPVVEMLRDALDIAETDPPDEVRRKLSALLAPSRDGELVERRLAGILGVGDAQPAVQEAFWAIRKLIEQLAASRPVVVVFDDIHWGEPTFLDLLEYLADWMPSAPVLLLCLARPELLEVRPGWTTTKANAELISLQPLDGAQTRELLGHLVGGGDLVGDAFARIGDLAEGNPLFVQETVRMLVDTGAIQRVDGHWTQSGDLARISIPPTIQAILAARVDRLGHDERQVLQRASVVGGVFRWSEVAALCDESIRSSVTAQLQSLIRKGLIRPQQSELEAEDSFRFGHMLIRDAAYDAIPKAERAELHERFARWLDEETRERAREYDEIVGYHFEQAHRTLVDLGRRSSRTDELAGLASERLAASGRRAFIRGDMPAAVTLLGRAIGLLEASDRRRHELLPPLAFALMETGDFGRLQEVVAEADAAATAAGDPAMQAHVTILGLWIRLFTDPVGWAETAQREAARARAVFAAKEDPAGLARASVLLGLVHMMKGEFGPAEAAWQEASAHARQAGDQRDEMESLSWVPLAAWAGPRPSQDGLRRTTELLELAAGDKKAMSSALIAQAAFEAGLGRFDAARVSIRRARDLLGELSLPVWIAGPLSQLSGWVELLAGDPAGAERELRQGYETLGQIGEMSWFSTVAGLLGEAVLANGRLDEAEQLANSSRDTAAPDDVYSQVLWRTVAAKVHARRGDAEEAERLAREAVEFVERTDFLHLQWHTRLARAEILAALGRPAEAVSDAEAAQSVAERKGSPVAAERAARFAQALTSGASPLSGA